MKNKRLLTILLLAGTLVYAGLAVFLAISINNRNVNPDDTDAASACEGVYNRCMTSCVNQGAANCAGTTCRRENDEKEQLESDVDDLRTEVEDTEKRCNSIPNSVPATKVACQAELNDLRGRLSAAERDLRIAQASLQSCLDECYDNRRESCDPQCEQEALDCQRNQPTSTSNPTSTRIPTSTTSPTSTGASTSTPSPTSTLPGNLPCSEISFNQCPSRCTQITCENGDRKCASQGTSASSVCPQRCGSRFCGGGEYCGRNASGSQVCCPNGTDCSRQGATPTSSPTSTSGGNNGGSNPSPTSSVANTVSPTATSTTTPTTTVSGATTSPTTTTSTTPSSSVTNTSGATITSTTSVTPSGNLPNTNSSEDMRYLFIYGIVAIIISSAAFVLLSKRRFEDRVVD